jgi:hypothetical protein
MQRSKQTKVALCLLMDSLHRSKHLWYLKRCKEEGSFALLGQTSNCAEIKGKIRRQDKKVQQARDRSKVK